MLLRYPVASEELGTISKVRQDYIILRDASDFRLFRTWTGPENMYNGTVSFYIMDPNDPLLAMYNRAFRNVFKDLPPPVGERFQLRRSRLHRKH
jgi:hypothetical protein